MDGHKIPPLKEIKGKMYYKWHKYHNYTTTSCIFWKDMKEDMFEFPEKGMIKMVVDTNNFPTMIMIMVSFL